MKLNSKNWLSYKIGILGGGQLARMLVLAGQNMGLNIFVLSAHKNDPAAQVCNQWHKGSPNSLADLKKFMKKVDVLTFESEFFDSEKIAQASKSTKTPVHPKPILIGKLQDRLKQKELFLKHKLDTADFCQADDSMEYNDFKQQLGGEFVLKARRFGYDGYSTVIIKSSQDLKRAKKQISLDDSWIAESFIPFRRELAVQIARNSSGDFAFLPLCQTHQTNAQCDWVVGPTKNRSWPVTKNRICKFMDSIKYTGILAFEFFEVHNKLIINELAPRVHNSGHHSLQSLSTDQFEYHLLAVSNQSLTDPKLLDPGFAMANLLGKSKKNPQLAASNETKLHWYGKKENRPRRKMGHINAVAGSPKLALAKVLRERKRFTL